MNKDEFSKQLIATVNSYISNFDRYDNNPQIRVNPATLEIELVTGNDMQAEIEDSDEAVENAAIAQGMATQEASDFQVTQNPDFYAVKGLLKPVGDTDEPNIDTIEEIVNVYFK